MELLVVLVVVAVLVVVGLALYVARSRGGAAAPGLSSEPAPDTTAPVAERRVDESPVSAPAPPERVPVRDRLARARATFSDYVGSILSRGVDQSTWDDLEEALVRADVGVGLAGTVLASVKEKASSAGVTDGAALVELLKDELKSRLGGHDRSLSLAGSPPSVWLFVGVNGVGKTTTIGKLAHREVVAGRDVVLAAGDTFRAAASEQLAAWAERSGAAFVRGSEGGDPSAVVFDAVEHAAARGAELVLADTAGRLHTKSNLMDELRKVRRVAEKGAGTVTEVLLVLDATTGQNGLVQAREFTGAVELTGVVLTKLDGSAKGGIVLAIQEELGIPVKLVGLGEGIDDLVDFDHDEFVDALIG